MDSEVKKRIDEAVNSDDFPDAWFEVLRDLTTSEELSYLLDCYNWDDEFDIPYAIANHPKCDLGVALSLWWLGDAGACYGKSIDAEDGWQLYCVEMTKRIEQGHYKLLETPCLVCRAKEYRNALRAKGLPEIFFQGINEAEFDAAEERSLRQKMARNSAESTWQSKPRSCPKCQQVFVAKNDRGQCTSCGHIFYASHPSSTSKEWWLDIT